MRSAPRVVTERLVLRSLSVEDVGALVRNLMADPQVTKFLPVQPDTVAAQREAALDYVESLSEPWEKHGHGGWAVCLKSPGNTDFHQLIGYCGFFESEPGEAGAPLPANAGPEFGYGYARQHWGKGYATEAARAALEAVFEVGMVEAVFATCDVVNVASRRVLDKAGMHYRGDHDLFDSVSEGLGLMSLYVANRADYLGALR